jgi:hypothetical protein
VHSDFSSSSTTTSSLVDNQPITSLQQHETETINDEIKGKNVNDKDVPKVMDAIEEAELALQQTLLEIEAMFSGEMSLDSIPAAGDERQDQGKKEKSKKEKKPPQKKDRTQVWNNAVVVPSVDQGKAKTNSSSKQQISSGAGLVQNQASEPDITEVTRSHQN